MGGRGAASAVMKKFDWASAVPLLHSNNMVPSAPQSGQCGAYLGASPIYEDGDYEPMSLSGVDADGWPSTRCLSRVLKSSLVRLGCIACLAFTCVLICAAAIYWFVDPDSGNQLLQTLKASSASLAPTGGLAALPVEIAATPQVACGFPVDAPPVLDLSASAALQANATSGAAPWSIATYAISDTGYFRCADGSAQVPAAAVNDDYCDCKDGSDEPGTGACAGLADTCFFCRNEMSTPKLIYSSRVGDGLCDCCDGSDEAGTSNPCSNTCEAEGAEARERRKRKREAVLEGLRLLEESGKRAQAEVRAWWQEKHDLEQKLPGLEAAMEQERKKRNEAQGRVDAEKKAAQEAREKAQAEQKAKDSEAAKLFEEDFEAADAILRWNRAEGGGMWIMEDPKGKRGKVLAMSGCTWGGDAFSKDAFLCGPEHRCTISFWARGAPWQGFSTGMQRTERLLEDAHSWLAVPTAHEGGFADRLLSTQTSDDWVRYEYEFPNSDEFQLFGSNDVLFSTKDVHIMVQSHASTGQCSTTMFDDFSVVRSQGSAGAAKDTVGSSAADPAQKARKESDDGKDQKTQPMPQKPEVSEYAKWALDQELEDDLDDSFDEPDEQELASAQKSITDSFLSESEQELAVAQGSFDRAEQSYHQAKKRKTALEGNLKHDLGKGLRWFSLVSKCAEKRFLDYNYKICFFDDAKQDHTRLGRYTGWADGEPLLMKYENGQHCHAGPARSLRVRIVCGAKEEIISVSEPTRCTYEAVFEHPGACTQEDLLAVDDNTKSVRLPHDEL